MDPEASQTPSIIKWQTWAITNQKRIRTWGGAGVIVAAILIIFAVMQSQKEAKASAALSDIKAPLNYSEAPDPATIEAYLAVAQKFPGTRSAGRALLLAASGCYMESRFDEAQGHFEKFLADYASSPWIAQAHFGIASALDARKMTSEAIAKYEEVRRRFATSHVAEESRLCLGRLYEQENRLDEAYQIYDELVKAHPGAGIGAEAGLRREDLLERFPQLAGTNAPAINPLTPTPGQPNVTTPPIPLATDAAAAQALVSGASNVLQSLTTNAANVISNLPLQIQVNPPQPGANPAPPAPSAPLTPETSPAPLVPVPEAQVPVPAPDAAPKADSTPAPVPAPPPAPIPAPQPQP